MNDYKTWIEAEEWAPGEWNPLNGNTDVSVTLADDEVWTATFFTYSNVASLVKENRQNGSGLGGKYFWARNMILVEEISRARIEEVIARLMISGEFYEVFEIDDGDAS